MQTHGPTDYHTGGEQRQGFALLWVLFARRSLQYCVEKMGGALLRGFSRSSLGFSLFSGLLSYFVELLFCLYNMEQIQDVGTNSD